ncbi:hypothetical protein D9M72_610880 [compost metagenome]
MGQFVLVALQRFIGDVEALLPSARWHGRQVAEFGGVIALQLAHFGCIDRFGVRLGGTQGSLSHARLLKSQNMAMDDG